MPDFFDMYIFNDFHGYGMIELAENAVSATAQHRYEPTIRLTTCRSLSSTRSMARRTGPCISCGLRLLCLATGSITTI
jgi:hypothetical protein